MTNPRGAKFERLTADYLAAALDDPDVDRQVKTGAADKGDIRGVRIWGQRIAVECTHLKPGASIAHKLTETEVERGNLDALAGVLVHKRHGKGQAADQLVTMTLRDFAAIISGHRP